MAQQESTEEIDLGYIFRKSNNFFKRIIRGFFLILDFFKKYFIIIIVLLIIGFVYGYYKDINDKTNYNNEVIVIPNFESADYLYAKVEAINNKISRGDTLYLQGILDTNFRKLKKIKIEPISDIYNFISKSSRNFDVLRLISEKKDITEYMDDFTISKYYKYHRMDISIVGNDVSEKIISDLFSYLNENEHFKQYQKIYLENNTLKIQEHYKMISQIDSVLMANSRISTTAASVSITNSTDLFDLIDRKRQLLGTLLDLKTEEVDFGTPIKIVSADYNLKPKKFLTISNKIKYPLFLIFVFSMVFLLIYIINNLKRYSNSD